MGQFSIGKGVLSDSFPKGKVENCLPSEKYLPTCMELGTYMHAALCQAVDKVLCISRGANEDLSFICLTPLP